MSKQSKIPAAELAIFCQELYQLVQSGLPIADGLNMLLEDETDRRTKAWLAPLCAHAEEGMPLAQAMRQTEAFPDYMTDMVALAGQTGRLQDVLPALSAHYTRQDRMIDDVRRAFAIPIALFCVMLAVVFLLITQVLPVFSRVFAQIGVQMSPVAARLMHIGQVLSGAGLGIAIVLGVVVVLALVVLLVPAQRARVTGFVRFHLGGRGTFGQIAAARFASAMSMAAVPRRHCPRAACFPRGMAVCLRCPSAPVRWLRRWNRSQSACRKIPCVGLMATLVRLSRPLSF